jgi:hypothetical protein
MRLLPLITGSCMVFAAVSASADQTCKSRAIQQKLAGDALLSFVKQCEFDTLVACTNQTAKKPNSDLLMESCVVKALGVAPKWCDPYECKINADCTGGAGCGRFWAGLCGQSSHRGVLR